MGSLLFCEKTGKTDRFVVESAYGLGRHTWMVNQEDRTKQLEVSETASPGRPTGQNLLYPYIC